MQEQPATFSHQQPLPPCPQSSTPSRQLGRPHCLPASTSTPRGFPSQGLKATCAAVLLFHPQHPQLRSSSGALAVAPVTPPTFTAFPEGFIPSSPACPSFKTLIWAPVPSQNPQPFCSGPTGMRREGSLSADRWPPFPARPGRPAPQTAAPRAEPFRFLSQCRQRLPFLCPRGRPRWRFPRLSR